MFANGLNYDQVLLTICKAAQKREPKPLRFINAWALARLYDKKVYKELLNSYDWLVSVYGRVTCLPDKAMLAISPIKSLLELFFRAFKEELPVFFVTDDEDLLLKVHHTFSTKLPNLRIAEIYCVSGHESTSQQEGVAKRIIISGGRLVWVSLKSLKEDVLADHLKGRSNAIIIDMNGLLPGLI
ncbi:WecB/TagA/CpsF family glycosyltransferase [Tellurirhabdus rosea]|uniref:WecB/TagA/CpsF family glycosyltransferase n=1 Tax=Tellurirhabdus rosea TaxID=2674997 RepID=UPI0022562A33|nr:WecB/TagA/CpsF family glycosyltransferase [Tellurirhabdus rosea]